MKIKLKVKYLGLLILLLTVQFSCNQWTELLPPEGLIREEFWKSKEDVEAVLMGTYQSFASLDGNLFKYGEFRADMITPDIRLGTGDRYIMESNIFPDNGLCNWSSFYRVINYANEVIKNAPLVKEIDNTYTDYQLKTVMSEAYFLRALAYFYLVRVFKDVPLVLEPSETDDSEFYPALTNGDVILDSMLIQLEKTRNFAPSEFSTMAEYKGRATKAAVDALISDIALWKFDYDKCIEYADKIIQNDKYELVPNVLWYELFSKGNTLEGIFEFQFDQGKSQTNSLYGMTREQSEQFDPSQKAVELFGYEYSTLELTRGEDASIAGGTNEDEYIIWKYVGREPDGDSERATAESMSANWIVYRLADIYLMKAEALAQKEMFTEALQIINMIRERANVPAKSVAFSKVDFEDAILEERALELAYEGKRWFDLLRMGRRNDYARKKELVEIIIQKVPSLQKRILATKLANPLGWYLPISESEIERNPALVQNPYYKF